MSPTNGPPASEHDSIPAEVELRYDVSDIGSLRTRLESSAVLLKGVATIIDRWYAPNYVVDYVSHETWLASGEAAPLRLREIHRAFEDRLIIEVKRPVQASDYSTNYEASLTLASLEQGDHFARALGYRELAVLEKRRELYAADEIELAVDTYYGLGTVVEIELARGFERAAEKDGVRRRSRDWVDASWIELEASAALTLIRRILE